MYYIYNVLIKYVYTHIFFLACLMLFNYVYFTHIPPPTKGDKQKTKPQDSNMKATLQSISADGFRRRGNGTAGDDIPLQDIK